MKARFRALTKPQKAIIILASLMAAIFAVVYAVNASKLVMRYYGGILTPSQEGEKRIYTGKVDGEALTFTARGDTVTSLWGGEAHTYTVKEDPSAISEEHMFGEMLGVEVWEGDELLFRGGWNPDHGIRINEKGEMESGVFVSVSGITANGMQVGDPPIREPAISTVLSLWSGPELTGRVDGRFYFPGLLLALMAVAELLFAQDLFRWNMYFQVKNPERVEPSDWEIFSRTFGGAAMSIVALVIWILPFYA